MSRCNTCEFCIRKEPFYDVKCKKLQRTIYDAKTRVWCDYWQEKKVKKDETSKS